MAATLLKHAWQCFAPGGIILLLAIGFLRPHGLPGSVQGPVSALPFIVLGFGLIFGWYMASSRLILSLLVLALLDRGILLLPPADPDPGTPGPVLFAIATFLTPLNLLALSLIEEGGVLHWRGLLRLLLVLFQPFLVLWLCLPEQANLAAPFQFSLLPITTNDWTPIPQPALLAFGSAILLLSIKFLLFRDPLDGGAVWALLTTLLATHSLHYGWTPTNFISAAGLTLFLSLVHASHQRTYRDELTGALGRLAFEEMSSRMGEKFVVAIVGVDQLKQYQNQYGKSVAEQVLRLIAPKIMAAAKTGKVYRIAGDEFTLVFPDRTVTETLAALERIRKGVEQTTLRLRNQTRVWEGAGVLAAGPKDLDLPVSVSAGVAEPIAPNSSITAVIKTAYRALYEAKGEGGNIIKRGIQQQEPAKLARPHTGHIIASGEFDY